MPSAPPPPDTSSIWQRSVTAPSASTTNSLPERADVVVVGAGIAGAATAIELLGAGLDVVLLDAATPASGTTGHSSAKVSLVHELHAHRIARRDGAHVATDYVRANRFGLDWIAAQLDDEPNECGWERRAGITYVTDPDNDGKVDAEVAAMRDAGEDARRVHLDLPYPTSSAISVADQAQFDPVRFVDGLSARFERDGGTMVRDCRATGVTAGAKEVTVHTTLGDVACGWVVVATGLPFVDRGVLFARTKPKSSYVIACDVGRLPPEGMYLSADGPTRSLRTATVDGRTLLLVGGEGHSTGQGGDTRRHYEQLSAWTNQHFEVSDVVARFSAHDYTTPDLRPFVGPILPGHGRVLVATGFNKWGFTNAAAGAEVIKTTITGDPALSWSGVFSTSRLPVSGVTTLLSAGVDVAAHMIGGWADGLRSHDRPAPNEGRVTRRRGRPVAVSTDASEASCAVSGVCTHLGGIVAWNPAEQTWDCPLHGSRFERDGTMRHGPAAGDLGRID